MKKSTLYLFFISLVFFMSLVASAADVTDNQAVVFMYHRFGEHQYPSTNTRLEQFDKHIRYLVNNNYNIWPLQKIVSQLRDGMPIPDKTVAITVDDAYLSVYKEAYPRLKTRSLPFTIFVSTDNIDANSTQKMSWQHMREMQDNEVSFANHSSTHDHLVSRLPGEDSRQWKQRIIADINKAQQRLQAELGKTTNSSPMLFAYPYGEYSEALAEILDDLGYIAFGQQSGPVSHYSDHRAYPRFPMSEAFAGMENFELKANTLALPVISTAPWEPMITKTDPPSLQIRLGKNRAQLDLLACYLGNKSLDINWKDMNKRIFTVTSPVALPPGRSRYNCTVPEINSRRYYWYSHPWFKMD